MPRRELPRGVREGTWLQVELADDRVVSAAVDGQETARAKERIADKLARLRRGHHLK